MRAILNVSAYLFAALDDTASLREQIRTQATQRALKGTVRLADEGINLFLAGQAQTLRETGSAH